MDSFYHVHILYLLKLIKISYFYVCVHVCVYDDAHVCTCRGQQTIYAVVP